MSNPKLDLVIVNRNQILTAIKNNHQFEDVLAVRNKIGEFLEKEFQGLPLGRIVLAMQMLTDTLIYNMIEETNEQVH